MVAVVVVAVVGRLVVWVGLAVVAVVTGVAGSVGGDTVVYVWLTYSGTCDAGYSVSPVVVCVVAGVVVVVFVVEDCQYINNKTRESANAAHAQ